MDRPFTFHRGNGAAVDLTRTNLRERATISASLEKVFESHSRLYEGGFNPPHREWERCFDELREAYGRLVVFRNFLRTLGNVPMEKWDSMVRRYQDWLGTDDPPEEEEFDLQIAGEPDSGSTEPTIEVVSASPGSSLGGDVTVTEANLEAASLSPDVRSKRQGGSTLLPLSEPLSSLLNRGPPIPLVGDPVNGAIPKFGKPLSKETRHAESHWMDQMRSGVQTPPGEAGGPKRDSHGSSFIGMTSENIEKVIGRVLDARAPRPPPQVVGEMSLDELSSVISNLIRRDGALRGDTSYDYTPRRHHILDLEKFTGDVCQYPIFRQTINVCLERERFRDSKDKAIFIFKYLGGSAKELVTHLMYPLAPESWEAILNKLDRVYGREHTRDRLLIQGIYRLPKLSDLTQEGLLDMITTLEAAMPALMRREPENTESLDGEKLCRLLSLLPQIDRDLFYVHCRAENRAANLAGLLHYLNDKYDVRSRALFLPFPKQKKRQAFFVGEDTTEPPSDSEDHPATRDCEKCSVRLLKSGVTDAPPDAARKTTWPCKHCGGAHPLSRCESFLQLSLGEKRKVVDRTGACLSCLAIGHYSRNCRSKRKCTKQGCESFHHPSLHDDYVMRVKYFEEIHEKRLSLQDPLEEGVPPQEQ